MTTAAASELHTEYRHIRLDADDILAYRDSGGDGPVLLFLHDFASFSGTWNELLRFMPEGFRYIRVDLKGFGFSLQTSQEVVSNFDQAELLNLVIIAILAPQFGLVHLHHILAPLISVNYIVYGSRVCFKG